MKPSIAKILGKSFDKIMTGWLYTLTTSIERTVTFYYLDENDSWQNINEIREYKYQPTICSILRSSEEGLAECREHDKKIVNYSRAHHYGAELNPAFASTKYTLSCGTTINYEVFECDVLKLTGWLMPVILDDIWLGAFTTGQILTKENEKAVKQELKRRSMNTKDGALSPPTEEQAHGFFTGIKAFVDYVKDQLEDSKTLYIKDVNAEIEPYLRGQIYHSDPLQIHSENVAVQEYMAIIHSFKVNRTNFFESMIIAHKYLGLEKLHVFKPKSNSIEFDDLTDIPGAVLEMETLNDETAADRTRPFITCSYSILQETLHEHFVAVHQETMLEVMLDDPAQIRAVMAQPESDLPDFTNAILFAYANNKHTKSPVVYILFFHNAQEKTWAINSQIEKVLQYASSIYLTTWYAIFADYHRCLNNVMTQFVSHELSNTVQGMKVEILNLAEKYEVVYKYNLTRHKMARELLTSVDELLEDLGNYIQGANRYNDLLSLISGMTDSTLLSRKPEYSKFYPNYTLYRLVDTFEPMFKDRDRQVIRPATLMDSHTHIQMYADVKLFQMIATNLINNACKYSHEHTRTFVNCGYVKEDNIYRFSVTSFGEPLSEETCRRIFDMGYRTDDAKKIGLGMGIGLFLVKRFAELHGGKAYVESEKICDKHISYLRMLFLLPDSGSSIFPQDKLDNYYKVWGDYRNKYSTTYTRSFFRGSENRQIRYIKRFIDYPTAQNTFVVEFPHK